MDIGGWLRSLGLERYEEAFRENAMYDAIKLALVGGRADSVVLENSKSAKMEYGGMQDLKAPRKAIILVASGIDTFGPHRQKGNSRSCACSLASLTSK